MRSIAFLIVILLFFAGLALAESERPVGLVKTSTAPAFILRDGKRITATPGASIMQGDQLTTGPKGSLGVILRDDTVLSLGSASQTSIERFDYQPAQGSFGMVLKLTRGLMEYLSGKISKLAPGSVHIETPVATLGVRGTHLLARVDP